MKKMSLLIALFAMIPTPVRPSDDITRSIIKSTTCPLCRAQFDAHTL